MSQPDLGELMQKAQQVQQRLAEVQRELATRRVEGSAGGGMVTVTVSGGLRVLEVKAVIYLTLKVSGLWKKLLQKLWN